MQRLANPSSTIAGSAARSSPLEAVSSGDATWSRRLDFPNGEVRVEEVDLGDKPGPPEKLLEPLLPGIATTASRYCRRSLSIYKITILVAELRQEPLRSFILPYRSMADEMGEEATDGGR